MTTAHAIDFTDVRHIVLEGISWETYEQILEELEGRRVRVTYDEGDLEMMAPLAFHEEWKGRITILVSLMCMERDLDFQTLGSTTFQRRDLKKGIEPDDCFYVRHAKTIRNRKGDHIDLTVDPPPDLAIEIENTRASIPKHPIYAAIGVPELWRFDGKHLTVLRLRGGKYSATNSSKLFPFLPMEQFQHFVMRLSSERSPIVLREFREWIKSL